MIYFIKLLALFALLFLNVNMTENKRIFNKHHEFSSAIVSGSLMNSVATYVACHDVETSSDGKYSRKCNIIHGNMTEKNELATCDIIFQGKFTDDYTMHTLSSNEMLMVWCDDDEENTEHLLRYTFVRFPNCTTTEVTVAFDDHETLSNAVNHYGEAIVFNEDGTYNVYFENPKFCGKEVCRLTIDSQGKTIKEPTASYVPVDNPVVLMEAMPVNNSILVAEMGIDTGITRISLITPDGLKVLRQFPTAEWMNNDISISDGTIQSFRNKDNRKIECETFDPSGKSLMKNDIDISNQRFHELSSSNLPSGGFILLTQTKNGLHSNITKFDANYKSLGTVELPEFECDDDTMVAMREVYKENSQNCISNVCYDNEHVDLSKDCYDDNEFK